MSRKDELLKIIYKDGYKEGAAELVEEIVFIENNLSKLRKLPFISVNPRNLAQQKATPAAKQYKELLQQYTNCLKVLFRLTGENEYDAESPLRAWARARTQIGES